MLLSHILLAVLILLGSEILFPVLFFSLLLLLFEIIIPSLKHPSLSFLQHLSYALPSFAVHGLSSLLVVTFILTYIPKHTGTNCCLECIVLLVCVFSELTVWP